MLTDIQITLNPVLSVDVQARLGHVRNHAGLQNLDYEHSGHTGFASTIFVNDELNKKVDKRENYSLVPDPKVVAYDQHLTNRANPHKVSKTHVGLGNCDNTSDIDKPISTATQNALNSKADLVNGVIPASQLPSYVDDVVEFDKQVSGQDFLAQILATEFGSMIWIAASKSHTGDRYYRKFAINSNGTEAGLALVEPESGKIYVGKTDTNCFRWTGSNLVEISKSIALGETSSTAYAGNKGKANADNIANHELRISDLEEGGGLAHLGVVAINISSLVDITVNRNSTGWQLELYNLLSTLKSTTIAQGYIDTRPIKISLEQYVTGTYGTGGNFVTGHTMSDVRRILIQGDNNPYIVNLSINTLSWNYSAVNFDINPTATTIKVQIMKTNGSGGVTSFRIQTFNGLSNAFLIVSR